MLWAPGHNRRTGGRASQALQRHPIREVPEGCENEPRLGIAKGFVARIEPDDLSYKDNKIMKAMNKLGTTVNVGSDNPIDGHIFSLAYSQVTPFYREIARKPEVIRIARLADFIDYQARLQDQGITGVRTWRDREYCQKLRSSKKT